MKAEKYINQMSLVIIGISIGVLILIKLNFLLVLAFILAVSIFCVQYPQQIIVILAYLIVSKDLISMIGLHYGLIEPHTAISSIIYYLPELSISIGAILAILVNRFKRLTLSGADIIAALALAYLIIRFITEKDYSLIMVGYLRVSLFIIAYSFGRIMPKDLGLLVFDKLKWFTYLTFIFGVFDLLTQHKLMIMLGLGEYMRNFDTLLDNPNLTIIYHAGLPRLLGLFGSALATGIWATGTSLIWLFCYLHWGKKFKWPLLVTYATLLLTLTRADWIATIVGSVIILLSNFARYWKKIVLFTVVVMAFLTSLLYFNIYNVTDLISMTITGSDSSTDAHLNALLNGMTAIQQDFFVGRGLRFSPYFTGQVNNFESWLLDAIFSVGIFYVLLFFAIAVLAISKVDKPLKSLFWGQFVAYSIDGLMNHSWYIWITVFLFWLPLGYFVNFRKFEMKQGVLSEKKSSNYL